MSADPVATVTAWARGLGPGRRLVLRCATSAPGRAPASASDDVVRWEGCLQGLSAAELAELVAAAPRLVLRLAGCSCEGAPGDRGHSPAVRVLRPVLEQLGAADRLEVETGIAGVEDPEDHRAGGYGVSRTRGGPATVRTLPVGRRALFAWAAPPRTRDDTAGGGGATTGTAAPPRLPPGPPQGHGEAGPPQGHGEADPQVRLVRALREIHRQVEGTGAGGEVRSAGAPAPTTPRSRRLTSTGCTACSTCVRSCPTAALTLASVAPPAEQAAGGSPPGAGQAASSAPARWQLSADLSACIGCGRCLALCPAQALTDEGPMSWAELAAVDRTVLETVVVRACRKCQAPFGGEGELCQVCRLRQGDPFGSWLPPGYVAPRVYAPPPGNVPPHGNGPPADNA